MACSWVFRTSLLFVSMNLIASAGFAVPDAPADPKAVPKGAGRIDVSWTDLSDDEDGFTIERSRDGGSFSTLDTVGADVTNYTDTDFTAGTDDGVLFSYRVSAYDGGGSSATTANANAVTVFAGEPLYGWLDVTDYGATPDDANDDTEAIQDAFDALGSGMGASGPHVLYFPGGTYRISAPLLLEAHQAIQLVGDRSGDAVVLWDPDTAICKREVSGAFEPLELIEPTKHDDPSPQPPTVLHTDDTLAMIHVDGSDRSTFRNLTWDANCTSTCNGLDDCRIVAFDQSYCGRSNTGEYQTACEDIVGHDPSVVLHETSGNADSGTSHIDNVYRDAFVGLRVGHYGVQDSEITVRRSSFESNHAGISIEDANALQISVFHSAFDENRYGITNAYLSEDLTTSAACSQLPFFLEGGNVHVYHSNFSASSRTDVFLGRENNFTFFDLRSLGSFRFLSMPCKRGAPSGVSIARSRIELGSQAGPDDEGVAVWLRNQGPLFLFENVIDNSEQIIRIDDGDKPAVYADTFADTGVLSASNYYTTSTVFGGVENDVVSMNEPPGGSAPAVTLHDLPDPVDFMSGRNVYTVVDETTLRDVVYAALADSSGAVVHVPSGVYDVSETIVIPDGSDIVLLGDSEGSEFSWEGPEDGTLLEIDGDAVANVTIRDLQLDEGSDPFVAVRVTGLDEGEDREVLATKVVAPNTQGSSGFLMEGADGARVDFVESGASGIGAVIPRETSGFVVRAGDGEQAPKTFWSSTGGHNLWTYDLKGGAEGLDAHLIGGRSEKVSHELRVEGEAGTIVFHSTSAGTKDSTDEFGVLADEFEGTLSVVGSSLNDGDADYGAVIVDSDSENADIRSLGSVYDNRESPDAVQSDNEITEATFDRRMVKVRCRDDENRADDCVGATPAGKGFRTIADTGTATDGSILAGLAPLSDSSVPFFFDGEGATAQVQLDHLRIRRAGLALLFQGNITALLRDRFQTFHGDDPEGWLSTDEDFSLDPSNHFLVRTVLSDLALGTQSWDDDIHSHYDRDGSTEWTAYEYGGRLRYGNGKGGIGVTVFSQYDEGTDAYYRIGRMIGEEMHLEVRPTGGETLSCANDSTGVDPQTQVWQRFCVQVIAGESSTRIRAKVWEQEENEPAGFALDCVDDRDSRLEDGTVGVWARDRGPKFFDDLEVRHLDPADPPPEGCLTAAP